MVKAALFLELDLWSCDLKIHWKHLLSRGINCTKFGNFEAKGSKVFIIWSTDQPTGAYLYSFLLKIKVLAQMNYINSNHSCVIKLLTHGITNIDN